MSDAGDVQIAALAKDACQVIERETQDETIRRNSPADGDRVFQRCLGLRKPSEAVMPPEI